MKILIFIFPAIYKLPHLYLAKFFFNTLFLLKGYLHYLLKYELKKLKKAVYKEIHKKVLKIFC